VTTNENHLAINLSLYLCQKLRLTILTQNRSLASGRTTLLWCTQMTSMWVRNLWRSKRITKVSIRKRFGTWRLSVNSWSSMEATWLTRRSSSSRCSLLVSCKSSTQQPTTKTTKSTRFFKWLNRPFKSSSLISKLNQILKNLTLSWSWSSKRCSRIQEDNRVD